MTSVLNMAERLFGGFEEQLQIEIVKKDRIEAFNVSTRQVPRCWSG